jgi:hypothetical protein
MRAIWTALIDAVRSFNFGMYRLRPQQNGFRFLNGSQRPDGQVKIVFVPLVGCSKAYSHIRELTLNPTATPNLEGCMTRIAAC